MVRATSVAIRHVSESMSHPLQTHERVKTLYTWPEIAERTEEVYKHAMSCAMPDFVERLSLSVPSSTCRYRRQRLMTWTTEIYRYNRCGRVFGKIMCLVMAVDLLFFWLLEFFWPERDIDRAAAFKRDKFLQVCMVTFLFPFVKSLKDIYGCKACDNHGPST